jgi:hypothetical protein
MPRLTVVAGTVIETQRFINVPMRFGERYLARERREVWLRENDGRESKWIIHTRALPARRGHRVVLLARGQWIVGCSTRRLVLTSTTRVSILLSCCGASTFSRFSRWRSDC